MTPADHTRNTRSRRPRRRHGAAGRAVAANSRRWHDRSTSSATLELGGKSPNIFFADVMDKDDGFLDKAIEGLVLFAFDQGEVCPCPSRALIQESIYDKFMERCLARVKAIKQGNPLDTETMLGALASKEQLTKIRSYLGLGRQEGAQVLAGGQQKIGSDGDNDLSGGDYVEPTLFKGHNKMCIFQEEIFGPALAVTTFQDDAEALAIANDTLYGLGTGVWNRNGNVAYRMGRAIKAGRVWTNGYHAYSAHAAFGGYKESGARNPASAARRTRSCSITTSRPRTCWSATPSRSWASSDPPPAASNAFAARA